MNRRSFFSIDWGLLAPAIILVILSLITLFSIDTSLFKSQLVFCIVGIFAFLFFSQTNYKTVNLYAIPIYIVSIVLLIVVLIVGVETRGSVRWLEIFGFKVQFSEILKPFLAISLSSYLSSKNNYSLKTLFLATCFLMPVVFLVFLQPDLGNALIYFFVAIMVFIVFGFPFRFFFLGLILSLIMSPIFWRFLHDYQKQRILTFLNPNDPLGLSYNAIQSVIAVGSGMLLGRGLGLGTQSGLRFLPERHTDFIFATLSESLGMIGATLLLIVFAYLLYRIFTIFRAQDELLNKTFSAIVFFVIFFQFFVNIGMNIGILPIVGITLPFVSYGGSSLLSNFIFLGILCAMNKGGSSHKVLEIK
ncbi:MAG: FtsW/RodA/SpoVE family cell cycle protein [Candidatus Levybacteria bacterium]|nr:FtsW/RodA/SpoVE family cell cycle protein [Candidatus Levybacteria bacterium]